MDNEDRVTWGSILFIIIFGIVFMTLGTLQDIRRSEMERKYKYCCNTRSLKGVIYFDSLVNVSGNHYKIFNENGEMIHETFKGNIYSNK